MQSAKVVDISEAARSDSEAEMGTGVVENVPDGMVKRDLSRRHINMIGLAGMIVSAYRAAVRIFVNILFPRRALVCSLRLVVRWRLRDLLEHLSAILS